jgi:hypothetical protein
LSPSITSDHLLGHRYSRWRLHASASLRRISRTASTAPLIGTNHACRPCLASFTHAPSGLAYLDYSQWHHRSRQPREQWPAIITVLRITSSQWRLQLHHDQHD